MPSAPVPELIVPEHDFLLALTDPSLQMNVLPSQWSMPPFLPLQGELPNALVETTSEPARMIEDSRI